MIIQFQIIGKNGVGKRSLLEILNQHFQLEQVTSRTDVAIYLFEINDQNSLEYLKNRYNPELQSKSNYLIGNKLDLNDKRIVSSEQAIKFASKYNMNYHEISCITKQNISHLIYTLQQFYQLNSKQLTSERSQKSPTVQILKFNRISIKNINHNNTSQTESENSPNSLNKDQIINNITIEQPQSQSLQLKRIETQNDEQLSPLKQQSSIRTRQDLKQTSFADLNLFAINSNSRQSKQSIDSFKEKKSPQKPENEFNKIEEDSKSLIQQQSLTATPKNRAKWNENESSKNQQVFQRSTSKHASYTNRSTILLNNDINVSYDKFNNLLDKMKSTLQEIKQYKQSLNNNIENNKEQLIVQQIYCGFNPDLLQKQQIEKIQQKKKDSLNIYEISNLLNKELKQKNIIDNNNNQEQELSNQQKLNKERIATTPQKITFGFKEQVSNRFNRIQQDINYKCITPERQIIKCIDLNDNKNDILFKYQYRLKNGKIVPIIMRRNDNLITVAQNVAQQHKLDQQAYLQLLKILKSKY